MTRRAWIADLISLASSIARLGKRVAGGIGVVFCWLNRNTGAITALATVSLAVFTLMYLFEVREQRRLAYAQLALENLPEVEIQLPSPFHFDKPIRTSVGVINRGGPVEEFIMALVVICCEEIEDLPNKADTVQLKVVGLRHHRLGRGQARNRFVSFREEDRVWLEPALRQKASDLVYAYVNAQYIRPANPVQGAKEYSDSASFWWNSRFGRWMELGTDGHKLLEQLVKKRGVLVGARFN